MDEAQREAEEVFKELAPYGYEGEPQPAIDLIAQAIRAAETRIWNKAADMLDPPIKKKRPPVDFPDEFRRRAQQGVSDADS